MKNSVRWRGQRPLLTVVALFVVALFVASSCVVIGLNGGSSSGASGGQVSTASPASLPYEGLLPTALKDKLTAPAPLTSSEQAAVTSSAAYLARGEAPTLADFVTAVEATDPSEASIIKDYLPSDIGGSDLKTDLGADCVSCAFDTGTSGVAIATAICIVGGVESLGTACLAAVAAVAFMTAIAYFLGWGSASCSSCSQSAVAMGEDIILNAYQKDGLVENSLTSELSTMNATQNALDYEASAAAIAQLPDSTFNVPEALGYGGNATTAALTTSVGSQLAAIGFGYGAQLSQIEATTIDQFEITLGSPTGFNGYGCPVTIDTVSAGAETTGGTGAGACGATTIDNSYNAWGIINGYYGVEVNGGSCSNAYAYIQGGTPVQLFKSGTSQLTAYNLNTGTWENQSATDYNSTTFSSGAWDFNVSGSGSDSWALYLEDGMPLAGSEISGSCAGQTGEQVFYLGSTAEGSSYPYTSVGPVGFGGAGGVATSIDETPAVGGLTYYDLGGRTTASAYIYKYLYTLAYNAGTTANAYWTFLHLLGIYSSSELASYDGGKCEIPTPNELVPSNIPPSELATANASQMLNLFLTELYALGYDFSGANFSLSSSTFCGHGIPKPIANTSIGFAVYGLGYIYRPSLIQNSNGTANQVFADPETWNASGEIFLAPSLYDMKPSVNSTWLLPSAQTVWAYVIPLVSNATTSGYDHVVADGPTACVTARVGCQVLNSAAFVTTLTGNSTQLGGNSYAGGLPSNRTAGNSVYFTACYDVTPASVFNDPVYSNGPCDFNVSVFVGAAGPCGFYGGVVTQSGASCNGPAPPSPPSPSGTCGGNIVFLSTIVNGLASAFGSLFGFGCALAWLVGLVIVVVVLAVIVYIIIASVRAVGRRD
jgi:hypothetical protein